VQKLVRAMGHGYRRGHWNGRGRGCTRFRRDGGGSLLWRLSSRRASSQSC
jgi:hypothetical protein